MSIEQQAEEVDKVKRSENGVITDPFYLSPEHTLEDANNLMAKFRISGVPITENGKLVGIITNRDLKFETDFTKKIKESMTSENLITAKVGVTLDEAKAILAKSRKEKLPIVDDDFNLKGLITIKAESLKRAERVDELCKLTNATPLEITLAYLYAQPFQVIPIVGPCRVKELEESLRASEKRLTQEEVEFLFS